MVTTDDVRNAIGPDQELPPYVVALGGDVYGFGATEKAARDEALPKIDEAEMEGKEPPALFELRDGEYHRGATAFEDPCFCALIEGEDVLGLGYHPYGEEDLAKEDAVADALHWAGRTDDEARSSYEALEVTWLDRSAYLKALTSV